MDVRIQELIDFTKTKFGLDNYYLQRHQFYRSVNIFNETDYILSMEWFPKKTYLKPKVIKWIFMMITCQGISTTLKEWTNWHSGIPFVQIWIEKCVFPRRTYFSYASISQIVRSFIVHRRNQMERNFHVKI